MTTPEQLFADIKSFSIINSNEAIIKKYSRYFKEGYDAYGLTTELLHEKTNAILNDESVNLDLAIQTARLLVPTCKYEDTIFAILLLKPFKKQFTADTFREIGYWFELGIKNWAHCDVICGELLFPFLDKNIVGLNAFIPWRTAVNKFQRRAIPVTMIKLLKTSTDYQPYFDFIDPLMMDPEREVHQGLGWFLREAWKLRKKPTEAFLLKWKNSAARLIFQYATEKMTPQEKLRFKRDK
jgi:3-methyladenine DNA glycosylase AlkD